MFVESYNRKFVFSGVAFPFHWLQTLLQKSSTAKESDLGCHDKYGLKEMNLSADVRLADERVDF